MSIQLFPCVMEVPCVGLRTKSVVITADDAHKTV
jgi:hypothetical protein